MLPFPANRIHRIKIRMIVDQPFHLFLREADGFFEQLPVGFVNELNHIDTRDDNYK